MDPSTQQTVGGAAEVGAGALAGFFPQTGTTKTQGTTSNVQTGSTSGSTSSQLQNYLNTVANFFQNMSGTTGQTGTGTTTTTPNLSPQMQAYIQNLIGRGSALTAPSLTGYTAGQTQQINQNADLQKQAVNNIMAARGVGTSPVAATAQSGIEQNRINQITNMQEQIPVLQNQLQLQNMAQAAQIANLLPSLAGTTTGTQQQQTGTQTQQQAGGTTTQSTQNQFANTWQNLFNFLQSFGNTNQTQTTSTGGGLGGALQGAASVLGDALPFILASDKRLKKDIKLISQDKAIDKVRELSARQWKWKGGERSDSGFIAQEVEKTLPDAVDTIDINGKDIKAINYAAVIPYLVGAIQNLDSRVGV